MPGASTSPRLLSDSTRAWTALAWSLLVLPVVLVLQAWRDAALSPVAGVFLVYAVFTLVYLVLTLRVFLPATPEMLATRAPRARSARERLAQLANGGAAGFGFSVQIAAAAFAAAVVMVAVDGLVPERDRVLTLVTAAITVVAAWLVVAVSYAVEYARTDLNDGGLDFPGHDELGYRDYLYLSLAISTTFGTTDVGVTSTAVRRLVSGHSLMAFIFNTLILALVVAALIG